MNYIKYHEIDENPETNKHLAEIIESIDKYGWAGLPLLADGDQLFNGAHRATACKILDIEPEVHQIIIKTAKDEYEQYLIDQIAEAIDTESLYRAIKNLHSEGLVDDYSLRIIEEEWEKEE